MVVMSGNLCDLHIHTYYSDGRASPLELVLYSASLGLKHISVTDHDNTRGLAEALPLTREVDIEVIPGVELTCRWGKTSGRLDSVYEGDIDLLGYCFDPEDKAFLAYQEASLADVFERIAECARLISKSGCTVSLEDVLSRNPRYAGAMQLIEAISKGKNCVPGWDKALALFNREWAKVRRSRFTLEQAINAIHSAGGVAVLAHPTVIRCSRGWIQPAHIFRLVSLGLDGIEIYHPRMNEAARAYFIEHARKFSLVVTGGSDDHGWPVGFPRLGSQPVTVEQVAALKDRSTNSKITSKNLSKN
jgi:predicted metal-dependent phosphoesterase TrpH